MSFGVLIDPFVAPLNGNSQMTAFVDWSASEHDVTYVAAWPDMFKPLPSAPSDNFNGITVAASRIDENPGVYDTFSIFNADVNNSSDAVGVRTSIDLLAPGEEVKVLDFMEDEQDFEGTSAAAPHVTGAVALLQQFAKEQITDSNPAFHFDDSRRHEVMKAVLLNSADKLEGVHGSQRTIYDAFGQDWTQSEAFGPLGSSRPLDDQLGAGHLNVQRALGQYAGGNSGTGDVGKAGWSFQESGGVGDQFEYTLSEAVNADDYIAVTLVWDRIVDKTGQNDRYNQGDMFLSEPLDDQLSNMDLFVVRDNGDGTETPVAFSTSTTDSVEHIFYKAEQGGNYKIRVSHNGEFLSESDAPLALDVQQEFAVAWWAFEPSSILPGDYDSDGDVDTDDHTFWAAAYGSTAYIPYTGADGNGDGVIDAADYTVWRDAFAAAATSIAVPEPNAMILAVLSVALVSRRRR